MSLVFVFTIPVGPGHTKRLRTTLASLRAQNTKVRVALCDAGNSQACKDLAQEYSDIVEYVRHGPDQGQSDAINEGWQNLEGDIYSWLNADDYLVPYALDKISEAFTEQESVDVVYGQSLIFEDDHLLKGLHPAVTKETELITYGNIISQPSCFYRKSLLDELGPLRTELEYTMDWDLWVRFYKAQKTFHYTPDIISCVIWEAGTKTSNVNRARMREIYALTRKSHGHWRSIKTQIGFTLHYLLEYSPAAKLLQRFTRALNSKAQHHRAWAPSGEDPQSISLPIFSFGPERLTSIDLLYSHPIGNDTRTDEGQHQQECAQISIPMDLSAGDVFHLKMADYLKANTASLDKIIYNLV